MAFGCSIRFFWAFRCRYLGLNPLRLNSMYRCLFLPSLSILFCFLLSAGGSLYTIRPTFVHCLFDSVEETPNFFPSLRTQCSGSSRWRNLLHPSENLVMKFVLMSSNGGEFSMVLPCQSAAGRLSKEELRAFFRKVLLTKASGFAGASPSAKLSLHSINCMKNSASWSKSVPQNLSKAKWG